MLNKNTVLEINNLKNNGYNKLQVSKELNIERGTIRKYWDCDLYNIPNIDYNNEINLENVNKYYYSYLFGMYLGDGIIDKYPRTYRMRVFLNSVTNEEKKIKTMHSMENIFPQNKVSYSINNNQNCLLISVYNKNLKELFPQYGPGLKCDRSIVLSNEQEFTLDNIYVKYFLCGLLDSDGSCYFRQGQHKTYQFTNCSNDIFKLFKKCLKILDIKYSYTMFFPKTYGNVNGKLIKSKHMKYNILIQKQSEVKIIDNIFNEVNSYFNNDITKKGKYKQLKLV